MIVGDYSIEALQGLISGSGLRFDIGPFTVSLQSSLDKFAADIHLMYGAYPLSTQPFADFHVRLDQPFGLRRWFRPQTNFTQDGRTPFKPDFKKGEVIISEGEKETAFYIIAKGGVEVMKKEKVIGVMKQGDCFGEIAFITRKPRAATIMARTDVSLMVVNMSLMEKASLETQLQYYRIFLENLISRLSQATDKLSASDKTFSET